jgi:hypothetical protein
MQHLQVSINIGSEMVPAVLTEGIRVNMWDIPMARHLEMARCSEVLPDITVDFYPRTRGAWMAFLWDRQGSSLEEDGLSENFSQRVHPMSHDD